MTLALLLCAPTLPSLVLNLAFAVSSLALDVAKGFAVHVRNDLHAQGSLG